MAPDANTAIMPTDLLRPDLLRLNASPAGKEEAIPEAAQLLIAAGCLDPAYAASMLRRAANGSPARRPIWWSPSPPSPTPTLPCCAA